VVIYQEQVMRTATDLGGFTLGKADILRKAMGKKKVKLMDELQPEFIEGCIANDIKKKTAQEIWDLLLRFAKYGFVKAHAAGYAIIAYQCGFLKTYYRPEYLASCLTVRRRNPGMMMKLLAECRAGNITVLPPDINESASEFVATPQNFSMSINASGKGSSNMEADMDAAENARMNGTTDVRTETSPASYPQYAAPAAPAAK
jgi:DNA polymerase-3 subunit alpha